MGKLHFLQGSLLPFLFRAPTQNDGLKNFISLRGKPEFAFYYEHKAMYPWLDVGLDKLSMSLVQDSTDTTSLSRQVIHQLISKTAYHAAQSLRNGSSMILRELAFGFHFILMIVYQSTLVSVYEHFLLQV